MELTNQPSEFDPRPMAPKPLLEGPLAALARMAGDGGGRLFAEYAPRPKGGWRDLPGVLRITGRAVSAGGSEDHPRVHRGSSQGGQEARDGEALCGDDRARAYRGGLIESLLE